MSLSDLITPLNPWSLWVPFALLGLIFLAAAYFIWVTLH